MVNDMQRSKAYFILERFWATATDEEREALGIAQRDIQFVDLMPDDMVAVVRCKDCLYWQSGENECEKWEYCTIHNIGIGPHSFCSYGERKEADGDAG